MASVVEKKLEAVGPKVKRITGYQKEYTKEEVAKHNKENDAWIIIHGKVYDVQDFLIDHPGGPEAITNEAGTDATQKFEDLFHSDDARRQLANWCIGTVKGYTGPADAALRGKKGGATKTATASSGTSPLVYVTAVVAVAAVAYFFFM